MIVSCIPLLSVILGMLYTVFMGFLVSFLGQLPLGNMSFTATQICIQEGVKKAWQYAIGVTIVEMIYLRFALTGMDWVVKHKQVFIALGWVTVVMFLGLGILAFYEAGKSGEDKKAIVLQNKLHRFLLGLTMSALNPLQIPFWFLWSSILIHAKAIPISSIGFNQFTFGTGIGTVAGLAVYIHGGNWLVHKMKTSNKTLNKAMGIVFTATALLQLYRMIYHPWL